MNRYAVFAGSDYYPLGGWEDFKASFETESEARAHRQGFLDGAGSCNWAHVVDLQTGVILDKLTTPC